MAYFLCNGGSGTPEKREENYYPFLSYATMAKQGGHRSVSLKIPTVDIEKIDTIHVKGRMWMTIGGGVSHSKTLCYVFVGVKNGKWCYYDGTNWVVTNSDVTSNYMTFTEYDHNVEIGRVEPTTSTSFVYVDVNATISISDIVASAKTNGISFDFPNDAVFELHSNYDSEIVGKSCCFLINDYTVVAPTNVTATYVNYFGFSVNPNRTSSAIDTPTDFSSNDPQIEITWK